MSFVAIFVLGLVSSAVQAQIIYEPVRYQYGGQNRSTTAGPTPASSITPAARWAAAGGGAGCTGSISSAAITRPTGM
jgi:hypothetical protein